MESLSASVALVTGGGRGIGRAISMRLASMGAAVAVNYRRDEEAAQATVEAIGEKGGTARAYRASVDDDDALRAMVDAVADDLGPVDVLVNNAGLAGRGLHVADGAVAELDRLFAVHARAPFELSRLVLPGMRARGGGSIVMISSRASDLFLPGAGPYSMVKVAMDALAYTLAKEERRHGIRVNVVAPGLVDTEMGRRLVKTAVGGDIHDLADSCDAGEICRPEDVAEVVAFLVSPAARHVWGERVKVDSGDPIVRGAVS